MDKLILKQAGIAIGVILSMVLGGETVRGKMLVLHWVKLPLQRRKKNDIRYAIERKQTRFGSSAPRRIHVDPVFKKRRSRSNALSFSQTIVPVARDAGLVTQLIQLIDFFENEPISVVVHAKDAVGVFYLFGQGRCGIPITTFTKRERDQMARAAPTFHELSSRVYADEHSQTFVFSDEANALVSTAISRKHLIRLLVFAMIDGCDVARYRRALILCIQCALATFPQYDILSSNLTEYIPIEPHDPHAERRLWSMNCAFGRFTANF